MSTTTQPNLENDLGFAERAAGPCVFVLFGAAGDLTKRKLVPALFNLGKAKLLPDNFAVIGVSVDDLSLEDFRSQVTSFLPAGTDSPDALECFRNRLFYERGDFADPNTFTKLRERLAAIDAEQHTEGNYLFYLATAPTFFSQIVQQLGAAALSRQENGRWRRVVRAGWVRAGWSGLGVQGRTRAARSACSLSWVSAISASGSEPATMPLPAYRTARRPETVALRNPSAHSPSPRLSAQPTGPA